MKFVTDWYHLMNKVCQIETIESIEGSIESKSLHFVGFGTVCPGLSTISLDEC